MTEVRKDWLTGRTVLFAANRALRPNEFAEAAAAEGELHATAPCPFCPGQEGGTPPAVLTRADAAGHWRLRVIPNKFPVVSVDDATALGGHEVIVESARHVARMSELTVAEMIDVLGAYRERLGYWRETAHWRGVGQLAYGLVFKNLGAAAGASLAHVHSQLVALPDVPTPVAAELARARQSLAEHGKCAYCRLIDAERKNGNRVVLERDGFIAFCPYASLQPCEVWVMPTTHEAWFERRAEGKGSDALAEILHALLTRIEAVLPRPSYNILVRTSPWQDDAAAAGHWRIEILPRVNPLAGFELATQGFINPIAPDLAAQRLSLAARGEKR